MTPKIRDDASIGTLRTWIEAIQAQSKEKAKLEDEDSLDKLQKTSTGSWFAPCKGT